MDELTVREWIARSSAEDLFELCRARLARHKQPKDIRFVVWQDDFPRGISGKTQRQELEKWLR